MIEIEVSLCDQNNIISFPERPIIAEKESGKEYNNGFLLGSREERVALLKIGLTGKDIESLYLKFNDIIVIGINWHDLKKDNRLNSYW
jgi:hypothetical protein